MTEAPADDTDLHMVRNGWITVTPLHLDLTHEKTVVRLKQSIDCDF